LAIPQLGPVWNRKRVEQHPRVSHHAVADCQRWHGQTPRVRLAQAQVLIGSEKECAIALDWSANSGAEIVYSQFAAREAGAIGEPVACAHPLMPEILEKRTVQSI
jgi:hypothetical protein